MVVSLQMYLESVQDLRWHRCYQRSEFVHEQMGQLVAKISDKAGGGVRVLAVCVLNVAVMHKVHSVPLFL